MKPNSARQLSFLPTHACKEPVCGTPLILSASRRTDLPGCHPNLCASIIRNKISRLRSRYLHSVVFWSKQPRGFLENPNLMSLIQQLENPVLQLTITGLGQSILEPGIPPAAETVHLLPDLIELFKRDPRRIRWRFDPIIKSHSSIADFETIAMAASKLGIMECTISFPTYHSLKGSLHSQFATANIPQWAIHEKSEFLQALIPSAQRFGISLQSCAQPDMCSQFAEISRAACIDGRLLESLHPHRLPVRNVKDPGQRKECLCIQSEDIGDYAHHPCHGGCVYCYSKAGGPIHSRGRP